SGKLESASTVMNSVKDKREKVGRMLLMHANDREDIKEAFAGDIVALVGLKDTTTGDTLCASNAPIILERMEFPDPVIEVAVEPGERGRGIEYLDEIKGGNIPREYIPSVEKGMRETAATGSLIGFPIIDFKIRLTDGKYHDVDSSALAFEITGRGAMREAAQK